VAVIAVNDGELDKREVRKHNMKCKLLIPNGIEGILVEGFGPLLAAVAVQANEFDLDECARGVEGLDGCGALLVAVGVRIRVEVAVAGR
jgi:hypothetical protein